MIMFLCYKPIINFVKMKTFAKKTLFGYNFTAATTGKDNNDEKGEISIDMVSDT